jgi:hypothetical protein
MDRLDDLPTEPDPTRGLAVGHGLAANVNQMYRTLAELWEEGDQIFVRTRTVHSGSGSVQWRCGAGFAVPESRFPPELPSTPDLQVLQQGGWETPYTVSLAWVAVRSASGFLHEWSQPDHAEPGYYRRARENTERS